MTSHEPSPSEENLKRYLLIAHEITIRIDLVAAACEGHLNMTPPYAREYCYLQFRHICELIALGCLLLHGDLPDAQTQKAKKEWNAQKIMSLLTRKHTHAFPQSVTVDKEGDVSKFNANSKPNALTLEEFKSLYSECGEVLHRGTIQSLEEKDVISKNDYDKVIKWSSKIIDLLNQHLIVRSSGKSMFFVSLRTEDGTPAISILNFDTKSGGLEVIERYLKL